MRLWIDDVRPAPEGWDWVWIKSVNKARRFIVNIEASAMIAKEYNLTYNQDDPIIEIELIDIDHDAGDYASDGGDYIKLLDWLEETGRNYPIHIHSMNPVGIENMRRIIQKNGWVEV